MLILTPQIEFLRLQLVKYILIVFYYHVQTIFVAWPSVWSQCQKILTYHRHLFSGLKCLITVAQQRANN